MQGTNNDTQDDCADPDAVTAIKVPGMAIVSAGLQMAVKREKQREYNATRGRILREDLKGVDPSNSSWMSVWRAQNDR